MENFGIDLQLATEKANIRNESDILVIVMHWMLCRNNLRNVGIGDNKFFSEDDRPSELLPEGWNQDPNNYTLRYTVNKQIYILYATVDNTTLRINLLNAKTLSTAGLSFAVDRTVKSTRGSTLDDFITSSGDVIKRINDEIVTPILKRSDNRQSDPLLVQPPRSTNPPLYRDNRGGLYHNFIYPLRDIGRGDLDPLSRGGGGMIFQPFGPSGFDPLRPPGNLGIPPGARYDPPNPLRRLDPDNDHLPPPGHGYDDM